MIAVAIASACALPSVARECRNLQEPRAKIVGGQSARLAHWPGQAVLRLHALSAGTLH
jgi:hypothetical protein